jgi:tetratricopeptide (TPR) repeat protein
MSLSRLFKKRKDETNKIVDVEPEMMPQPVTLEDFMRRGWAYHSRQKQVDAEKDFRNALKLDADSVDANYVLGLILKAQDRKQEAVASFQRAIDLIQTGVLEDSIRAEMLRRLSKGHISEMIEGDWNLEKEVWKRAEEP